MATRPTLDVRAQVQLAPFTTLGVGGPARYYARLTTPDDVVAADAWASEQGLPLFVLGGGSNMVVADEGIEAVVAHVAIDGFAFTGPVGATVTAGAGCTWDALVSAAVERGLTGIECLSGVAGSVGGTPIQNVGAYGQEVSETIVAVEAFDRESGALVSLAGAECGFAYRASRFKGMDAGRFIVTRVIFELREELDPPRYPDIQAWLAREEISAPSVVDVRRAVLSVRRAKGMVVDVQDPDTRSVGSFFMNPVVAAAVREDVSRRVGAAAPGYAAGDGRVKLSAAWLIEHAGFPRGFVDGAAGISSKHTLALINRGGATARDVLRLGVRIKRQVEDRLGVALRPEPIFAGFGQDPDLAYLQR